ncbi:hypothetical protein LJK87_35325 [Paenibacillus sp. P25]|nr:hypothetical protein LJK87_35325 [Paenibacillus sp. P25]
MFQLGGFGAFAFIGKWMADGFHLSVDRVGYVMVFVGLGNLAGDFGAPISSVGSTGLVR